MPVSNSITNRGVIAVVRGDVDETRRYGSFRTTIGYEQAWFELLDRRSQGGLHVSLESE